MDHQTGQEMDQIRNVLHESARIARGAVYPITELTLKDIGKLYESFDRKMALVKHQSQSAVMML